MLDIRRIGSRHVRTSDELATDNRHNRRDGSAVENRLRAAITTIHRPHSVN